MLNAAAERLVAEMSREVVDEEIEDQDGNRAVLIRQDLLTIANDYNNVGTDEVEALNGKAGAIVCTEEDGEQSVELFADEEELEFRWAVFTRMYGAEELDF